MLLSLLLLALPLRIDGFRKGIIIKGSGNFQNSKSALFYDYFKKGPEKKEIGRLWKNIIFPGIFNEYADTKDSLRTVKVETKKKSLSRYTIEEIEEFNSKAGKYNAVDEASAPKIVNMEFVKTKSLEPVKKPANFVAPTPKKGLAVKSGGVSVLPDINKYPRPKKPIIIYEFEASAECKRVREACTLLDLIVEYRPCPGASSGFSDIQAVITLGRREVPFMVDNNPSMYRPQLFGSEDIINFLFRTYGPGEAAIPSSLKGKVGGGLFGGGNGGKGSRLRKNARPDNQNMKPIQLYGWEGAPYVKPVRETLTELGLPHIFINVASGSANRASLERKKGLFQVPFISDPNTSVEMFESAEIVKYLEQVYTI